MPKKYTKTDINKLQKTISEKLTQKERDFVLASLIVSVDSLTSIIEKLIHNKGIDLTKKEQREIERSASIGPQWLNYTVKVKDTKNGK